MGVLESRSVRDGVAIVPEPPPGFTKREPHGWMFLYGDEVKDWKDEVRARHMASAERQRVAESEVYYDQRPVELYYWNYPVTRENVFWSDDVALDTFVKVVGVSSGYPTLASGPSIDEFITLSDLETQLEPIEERITALESTSGVFLPLTGGTLTGPLGIGTSTLTTSGVSFAVGSGAQATGNSSSARGQGSQATAFNSHAEGGSYATGSNSHAEGAGSTASGYASHAEGMGNTAAAGQAHAEGQSNQITAAGTNGHAEGQNNNVTAYGGHVEGISCTVSGSFAHAGGTYCFAAGAYSFAHGSGLNANGTFQFVIGQNNMPDTTSAFIIGNGTSGAPSNCFLVTPAGDVFAGPTGTDQLVTQAYVAATFLPLTGGTIQGANKVYFGDPYCWVASSGNGLGNIEIGLNNNFLMRSWNSSAPIFQISWVGAVGQYAATFGVNLFLPVDPTEPLQAVTKQYVDNSGPKIIQATDEADAITQSASNPNNFYFWT